MQVHIAKVSEVLWSGVAKSATLPGSEGELTILPNHSPLATVLRSGRITVRAEDGEHVFDVDGGILEVNDSGATVLL
jgi:F-type H+-transporting ATPase subunit epsilon